MPSRSPPLKRKSASIVHSLMGTMLPDYAGVVGADHPIRVTPWAVDCSRLDITWTSPGHHLVRPERREVRLPDREDTFRGGRAG